MNSRVRRWIPICNSAHSLYVVSSLENGSTKHTKFHWLGGSTINAQAHIAFKVWRKDDINLQTSLTQYINLHWMSTLNRQRKENEFI